MKICSFTGNRPHKLSFGYNEEDIECIKLKAKLMEEIEKLYIKGVDTFLSGCAMGIDIWCAEIVLQLMQKHKDIKLFCILPCNNQDKNWTLSYKNRYKKILNSCTKVIKLQEKYTKDCYFKRNKYLVDNCNIILCVYNQDCKKGGTLNTLNYAISRNKKIIILNT